MTSYTFPTHTTVNTIILFVVAFALCPATGQTTMVTEDQLTKRSVENKQLRIAQEEALKQIILLRESLISTVKHTQDMLDKLAINAADYESKMSSLLLSDDGKKLAQNPKAVSAYANLEQFPVVSSNEIKIRLDEASSLFSMAKLATDGPEVGYLPSQETRDQIYKLQEWAESKYSSLSQNDARLNTLISNLPDSVDVSNAQTLNDALQEYKARMKKFLDEIHGEGKQISQEEARNELLDTFVAAEIRQMKAEQARIIALMDAKIANTRHEYELKLLEQKQIRATERSEADRKYQDLLAENERLRLITDANRTAKDTEAKITAEIIIQDAEYAKKLALARSIEVRELLAPFITKGYWQPNRPGRGDELSPISLGLLKKRGALNKSDNALSLLRTIATNPADKERPRWPFNRPLNRLKPEELEQIRQARQYLIDLGDILVQEGLLAK